MTHDAARIAAALCALLLAAGTAAAGEAHFYLAPYAFNSSLTGDGRISGGQSGTDFDLEDTLGIDPDEKLVGVDGFFKFLGSRIEFGYNQGEYSGVETLDSSFVINGITFNASERVRTDIDLKRYKLLYGFDFSLKVVNVGFVVGGHLIDADVRVRSSSSGTRERDDLRLPVPVLGVTLGVHPISALAIHAELTGMSVTISGIDGTLLEGFAGIHWLFVPKVGLVAGYRHFHLDAADDDEDNRIDVTQRGPYAGLALHL